MGLLTPSIALSMGMAWLVSIVFDQLADQWAMSRTSRALWIILIRHNYAFVGHSRLHKTIGRTIGR